MKKPQNYLLMLMIITSSLISTGCKKEPKVIQPDDQASSAKNENLMNIFIDPEKKNQFKVPNSSTSSANATQEYHSVVVKESLATSKYVYLLVEENERVFWIATNKMPVEIGKTYYYKGGLLKRNFESKEYNRVFDELYLVSKVVPKDHTLETGEKEKIDMHGGKDVSYEKIDRHPEAIKIAELIQNAKKYKGKSVKVSGICTKININIMNRNWIHLKDGTKDDYDLVVTSQTNVPVGHKVTMEATVVLKKDFGSGYYYDIILEDGDMVN